MFTVTCISGGNSNQNSSTILVILKDVNDNAPEFINQYSWTISENANVVRYGLNILAVH